ncbi:hypothetical protein ELY21_01015 [Legionella sp. km535]|uniref:hypothetical protein n=1 Tax=Legionella sp. km535 TaxID=2498107 RepID=UPI000F8E1CB2|nr:hypothetical protein [Legionella sp. km535]RUR20694.1 hypothetical protein ELY21_01015 [Legionella sp. km535]
MYSAKWFFHVKQKVKDKTHEIGNTLNNLGNPRVGRPLVKLQQPKLLFRVDGRSHAMLHNQGGLIARATKDELMALRFSDVEQYQKFNENPFGWGACSSLKHLEQFIKDNRTHTIQSWIHIFYGSATCLGMLKIDTGIEADSLDIEHEQLVLEHQPLEQWLASTCPTYQSKFLDGRMVPNLMVEFNEDLPKTMRKTDFISERNILNWLLVNGSEETFAAFCQHLYTDMSSERLASRVEGDERIIGAVEYSLKMNKTDYSI